MEWNKDRAIWAGKRLKDKVSDNDVSGASAELAYRFFLAIFPFFIFLAALGGFVASALDIQNPTDEIMEMIGDGLPDDAAGVLEGTLQNVLDQQNAGLLSIGILGAIWAAAGGFNALAKNMNRIYTVSEDRNFIMKYAISIALTLFAAGLIIVAFAVLFVGQIYGPQLAGEVGLGGTTTTVLGIARWPAALILVMVAIAFINWLAPNTKLPIQWVSPGAVFFAIGWIIATLGFSIYVSNFGQYNETYGTLGGIVILLFWFYITSFLILLGAAINSVYAEMKVRTGDAPAETINQFEENQQNHGAYGEPLPGVDKKAAQPAASGRSRDTGEGARSTGSSNGNQGGVSRNGGSSQQNGSTSTSRTAAIARPISVSLASAVWLAALIHAIRKE